MTVRYFFFLKHDFKTGYKLKKIYVFLKIIVPESIYLFSETFYVKHLRIVTFDKNLTMRPLPNIFY